MELTRPSAPDPYESLPTVPSFKLTSEDMSAGQAMPDAHTAAGGSVSPQLSWSDFPSETKSFAVTCFDPDAPTPAGFWHWTIVDLDSSVTSLDQGAGKSDLFLSGAAIHLRNDASEASYMGAAPPAGDVPHRYIFAVHALDVDSLEVDEDCTPTRAAFQMLFHTIARATLEVTYQQVADE